MSAEVRELVRDAAPEPSGPLDVEELWTQGRRQRRRRIVGAVGVVVVVLVAVAVGVPALLSQDVGPAAPEIVDQPTVQDQVPADWKTLRVGDAAFSVPGAWPVKTIDGPDDPMPCLERLITNDTRVWLADRLWQPPCPPGGPSPGQGQVSVYAFPASGGEGRGSVDVDAVPEEAARIAEHGQAVQLPGGEATLVESDHLRSYLFAEFDAVLMIAHRPNLELADQIAATVRPAEPPREPGGDARGGSEPGTADEVLGKWESGPPSGSAHLSVAWTDSAVTVVDLWGTFRLQDPPPPVPQGQAVLLVSTGESGSCPTQVTDVVVEAGRIELQLTEGPDIFPVPSIYGCTADFNPVTFAIQVDSGILEPTTIVSIGDTAVRLGQEGEIVSAEYGERPSRGSP